MAAAAGVGSSAGCSERADTALVGQAARAARRAPTESAEPTGKTARQVATEKAAADLGEDSPTALLSVTTVAARPLGGRRRTMVPLKQSWRAGVFALPLAAGLLIGPGHAGASPGDPSSGSTDSDAGTPRSGVVDPSPDTPDRAPARSGVFDPVPDPPGTYRPRLPFGWTPITPFLVGAPLGSGSGSPTGFGEGGPCLLRVLCGPALGRAPFGGVYDPFPG